MSTAIHNATAVVINGTTLLGITRSSHDYRNKVENQGNSGSTHVRMALVKRAAPMATFSTFAVNSLLGILAPSACDTPNVNLSSNGFEKYSLKNKADGPGIDSTGHGKASIAKGSVYLDKISWSDGGYVTADATVLGRSTDGTTNPLVEVSNIASASLPSLAAGEELYDLVSATQGGTAIDGLSSFEINFGHKAVNDKEGTGGCYTYGLPYPTRILAAPANGPVEITGSFETSDVGLVIPSTALTLAFGMKPYAFGGTFGAQKTISVLLALVTQTAEDLETASPGKQRYSFVGTVNDASYPWSYA
jgi:hypothetical protein